MFSPFADRVTRSNACEQNDVSGRCTVAYKVDQHRVTRTKLLETCKTAEMGFTMHSQVRRPPAHRGLSLLAPLFWNRPVFCPIPGVGCEQEVQLCYSVHTRRRFHPLRRG